MDGVIKEKMNIEMWAEARVNSADEKLFSKMKKAGFKAIAFGIDSGSQEVLDYYNKKTSLAQIKKAVNNSRKFGFYTYGTFILGAPIETKKHFEESINLAKILPFDLVAFFVLEYGAGSPMWEEAIKEGKITRNEYLVFADSARNLGNFPKEEVDTYAQKAHKEFYIRYSYFIDQIIQCFRRKDFRLIKALIKLAFKKDVTKSYWGT
jgi:anaerobic magnesium-protoporphyrin IX monomethyl ester cyclase